MLFLQPVFKDRIWGTPRLKTYGSTSNCSGSVYTVSGLSEINCLTFNTDNGVKSTLRDLTLIKPSYLGLKQGEEYPLVIDILGADEDLSIQVHPTTKFARKKGYLYGKDESWYVVSPSTCGYFLAGIKKEFQNSLDKERVSRNALKFIDKTNVKTGDYFYVPAGTIHAIKKGALVYEVQQATNITYRFFDYNRNDLNGEKRHLDIKDACANLIIENSPKKRNLKVSQSLTERAYSLNHQYFNNTKYFNDTTIACAITVLSGQLSYKNMNVSQGQSVMLLPHETVQFRGSAEVMIATPNLYWR